MAAPRHSFALAGGARWIPLNGHPDEEEMLYTIEGEGELRLGGRRYPAASMA